ncbi:glycosyltransferase [Actinokineospora auranticolor]|uniref:Galactofuranosylgalactofuranosylrhamnosyl-N-acetylglucosaminyl-diphospho-decaprenol beta-1,5/1,6-galactofuranosyltransferase n=1 Tax=Actinokineospora auranticolor TaxID=155976 RepID=A0A2S6GL38_9PSEU|nr:glycosyltransferase [Actinokineospora auranticolor]PPK65948.1 galactofuranosylgalactofuranosylrhamnosyl-N-acetylglucosaminyl-diphospho-decaprenol beta-1,5/1,6-galactofuranosyltransferase [Actinokineospora auranticolor]
MSGPARVQSPDAPDASSGPTSNGKLVDHVPVGRLVTQRGLFAGPSPIVTEDLYAEVVQGAAQRRRDRVVVEPGSLVSMNTYFGRFPASYWQRWTVVREVTAELVVTGSGKLSVLASDSEGVSRTIAVEQVTDAEARSVSISAKIDRFNDGGALWLDLRTDVHEGMTVESVRWTVQPPERLRPAAVVICTCNRADDCIATLTALADDPEALAGLDAIYVADQGSDTVDSRPKFAEVSARLGAKLRYIQQPNLGGAAGFTRGLYEAAKESDHANVLFMDDDVLLEPDIAIRLNSFANRTAEPAIVGGQMLNLLHPTQLHVGAEWADLENLAPGQVTKGALHAADLTGVDEETGKPNRQEVRVDAGYNGWWSCLIPTEIVQAIGYPLPLFFQWDDAEYGYRAKAAGFATVTLPGAGVWHADFGWKDWDDWHRYFNLRNSMITAALHSRFDTKHIARVLTAQMTRYLLSLQYGLAATLLKAVEDYLAGPEMLHDGGAAAVPAIRALRAQYPETVRHPASEVPGLRSGELQLIPAGDTPSLKRAVLIKRLAYRLLGRHVHARGAVSAEDATWWHLSLFDTAVVTDASQEGVRIRKYDRETMFRLGKEAVTLFRRFIAEGNAVQDQYKQAMPELTSRENWKRLYQL